MRPAGSTTSGAANSTHRGVTEPERDAGEIILRSQSLSAELAFEDRPYHGNLGRTAGEKYRLDVIPVNSGGGDGAPHTIRDRRDVLGNHPFHLITRHRLFDINPFALKADGRALRLRQLAL